MTTLNVVHKEIFMFLVTYTILDECQKKLKI